MHSDSFERRQRAFEVVDVVLGMATGPNFARWMSLDRLSSKEAASWVDPREHRVGNMLSTASSVLQRL